MYLYEFTIIFIDYYYYYYTYYNIYNLSRNECGNIENLLFMEEFSRVLKIFEPKKQK
jgi:hypothetical protein